MAINVLYIDTRQLNLDYREFQSSILLLLSSFPSQRPPRLLIRYRNQVYIRSLCLK